MKTAKSLRLTIPESFLLRADEVIELENLLQCECRLLALSGHTEMICFLSAFGAKRTCREGRKRFGLTQMTHLGHGRAAFAAMQGPDLIY